MPRRFLVLAGLAAGSSLAFAGLVYGVARVLESRGAWTDSPMGAYGTRLDDGSGCHLELGSDGSVERVEYGYDETGQWGEIARARGKWRAESEHVVIRWADGSEQHGRWHRETGGTRTLELASGERFGESGTVYSELRTICQYGPE